MSLASEGPDKCQRNVGACGASQDFRMRHDAKPRINDSAGNLRCMDAARPVSGKPEGIAAAAFN